MQKPVYCCLGNSWSLGAEYKGDALKGQDTIMRPGTTNTFSLLCGGRGGGGCVGRGGGGGSQLKVKTLGIAFSPFLMCVG